MGAPYNVTGPYWSAIAENNMVEPYVAVELGTNDQEVDLPDSTGDTPVGVIQHSASAGQAVSVQIYGISPMVANAAIAKGARVSIAATTGRIDDSADGTAATKYIGIALEAAGAGGEVIPVLLNLPGVAEDGGAS